MESQSLTSSWVDRIDSLWKTGLFTDKLSTVPMIPVDVVLSSLDGMKGMGHAAAILAHAVRNLTLGTLVGAQPTTPNDSIRLVAAQVVKSVQFFLEAIVVGIGMAVIVFYPRLCVDVHYTIHGQPKIPQPKVLSVFEKINWLAPAALASAVALSRIFLGGSSSLPRIYPDTDSSDKKAYSAYALADWFTCFPGDQNKCIEPPLDESMPAWSPSKPVGNPVSPSPGSVSNSTSAWDFICCRLPLWNEEVQKVEDSNLANVTNSGVAGTLANMTGVISNLTDTSSGASPKNESIGVTTLDPSKYNISVDPFYMRTAGLVGLALASTTVAFWVLNRVCRSPKKNRLMDIPLAHALGSP